MNLLFPRLTVKPLGLVALLLQAWVSIPLWAAPPPADRHPLSNPRRTPVVEVFEAAASSVVNISSTQIVQVRSPFGFDSVFDRLFDLPSQSPFRRRYKQTSVGSGFVIHPTGYIVTNAHVVARTAERKVIFDDKRSLDAQVVAIDHERDLAILKIDPSQPLEPIPLGTSSDLMVGETVIAIGNPLGYQHTVTSGVVSALNRTLDIDENLRFEGLIQTDASINPGNSGGPLLNILGQLIGVNTAIRGDAQNIGFAIPVDHLRQVLPDLIDVERRYRIITGLRVSGDEPCRVLDVNPDSPADKAGLCTGDVLIRIADQAVLSVVDYHIALIGQRPGQRLVLQVVRDGRVVDLVLTPTKRPKPDAARLLHKRFGLVVEALDPRMAQAIGLRGLRGLTIANIQPGSSAAESGLQRGDILVLIGRHQTDDLDNVGDILDRIKPGQTTRVTLLRVSGRVIYRISAQLHAR